ncbi:dehydrogenase [Microbacterium sp.]|uniref:dehydrogenase n=1 Tax=Microbacterium sp. TaxID=51671 RepID=UPI001ACC77F5|nr:dehydrogenase [Microbacterium sp.]MBN9192500.1 dehydrogenase [Microbacterium sp.]
MASEIERADDPTLLRNPPLTDALQTQDMAAIAFALRHGPTVVPLATGAPDADRSEEDRSEPWVYRASPTDEPVLLLFSDARFRPPAVPAAAGAGSPAWLRAYLDAHASEIGAVFLDFAGPHPLRATPADLIAALDA